MKDGKARSPQLQAIASPVTRRKVAIVRQGVENLERSSKEHARIASEMAKLRGEAIQARRLAEHIQMLATPASTGKQGHRPMTTSLGNREHVQKKRRSSDNRTAATSQLSFNPLHPSSELPPEQLIRLLGLETKKTRKQKKSRKSSTARKTVVKVAAGRETDRSFTAEKRHSPRKRAREARESQAFGNNRKSFLVPAMVTGALAGAAISAYLFLGEATPPSAAVSQRTASVSVTPETTPAGTETSTANRDIPVPQTASGKSTTAQAARPVPAVSEERIQAEQERLRREAEQRLSERVTRWSVARELAAASPQDPEPAETAAETPAADAPAENPVSIPAEATEAASIHQEAAGTTMESAPAVAEVVASEAASLHENTPAEIAAPATGGAEAVESGAAPLREDTPAGIAAPATDADDGSVEQPVAETGGAAAAAATSTDNAGLF